MIGGATRVYGLVGWPIEKSLSPRLHNFVFERLEIDAVYVPFRVPPEADLAVALRALRAAGVAGVNVTVPHKVAAARFCDSLGEAARGAGAVNTIVFRDGAAIGENTDVAGFGKALAERCASLGGKRALVLGAGGAARAALAYLSPRVERVLVAARSRARAVGLGATRIEVLGWEERGAAVARADIIVNATPLGGPGAPGESPLPPGAPIGKEHVVFDMVYWPRSTPLLDQARRAGATAVEGIEMLLAQAIAALEIWLGRTVPADVVEEAHEALCAEAGA
jgi:shikimate dehydrogenase